MSIKRYYSDFSKKIVKSVNDGQILALGRIKENKIDQDNIDYGVGFEVLALRHKSNSRISLRHVKSYKDSMNDKDEGGNNEDKHKSPQHRRFLTYPKVGYGTPSERRKMNDSSKLNRAATLAHKYKLEQLGYVDEEVGETLLTSHKGINSIIEDKIQLSILKGDFDNLSNAGKPLETYQNPLVDRTTDLGFDLLKKNGIRPEWIELQQIQNTLKEDLRAKVRLDFANYCLLSNQNKSLFNIPAVTSIYIDDLTRRLDMDIRLCNEKVDSYNLQVPSHILTRGRFQLSLEIESFYSSIKSKCKEDIEKSIHESIEVIERCKPIRNSVLVSQFGRNKHEIDSVARPIYSPYSVGSKNYNYSRSSQHVGGYNESPLDRIFSKIMDTMLKPVNSVTDYLIKHMFV